MTEEGDHLLEDNNLEPRQVGNGESDRLNLGKDPASNSARFSDYVVCPGGERFGGRWIDNRQEGGSVNAKFFDCEFDVNPGITSAQLLATLDDIGQECVPETYPHRTTFMAIRNEFEVTEKPHKNDELRIQHAQEGCDYSARFQQAP